MERATSAIEILDRMLSVLNLKNDSELSKELGVTSQAVSKARNTGKLPVSWVPKLAQKFNISTDWLFFGCIFPAPSHEDLPKGEPEPLLLDKTCARCAKLEAKLDILEEERRELATENRTLWTENGDLREENATLRERQRKEEQASLFDEKRAIPHSDPLPPVARVVKFDSKKNE